MPATHTFICGCGHSGTSLMANMFASHPGVFIPLRETEAFMLADTAGRRWSALRAEAEASGRPHFVEKTPRHVLRLPLIRRIVPDARFVILVRDGRDVAASFIKRTGTAAEGARRWLDENAVVLNERAAADVQVIRYEDLITAPGPSLEAACAFAGVPFDPAMLDYHATPRLWFGVAELKPGSGANGRQHRLLRNWQINQPIFDGRDKWRELLGADDLALFRTPEAREMLAAFGYD